MQTLLTLEVRWFKAGKIPPIIEQWFLNVCPDELSTPTQEVREDQYFYTPGCESLNLKLRQGKLELKWRQTELGVESFGVNQSWQGRVERWLKWSYQESTPSDLIKVLGTGDQPILTIKKQRLQWSFQGINFELTQLQFSQDKFWWSLGFEMEETPTQGKTYFEDRVNQVVETYPETAFNLDHSHSYPSWLLEQVAVRHLDTNLL